MARPSAAAAHYRAKIGALSTAVHAGYRRPDDPVLAQARRDLRAEILAEHVARVVAQAPPLSAEQVERIAALLRAGA
jgi:hypothetical protein